MTLHLKPPLETAEVPLTNGDAKAKGDCSVTLELEGDDMNEALQ